MTGTHLPDLDDHWDAIDSLWPRCPECKARVRRDLVHVCGPS